MRKKVFKLNLNGEFKIFYSIFRFDLFCSKIDKEKLD